jgi:hypothetical protein
MSDTHLTRLKALREFGIPLAEQKEAEGHLDFLLYMSECGTYGCLLGWWATTEYAQRDGWHFRGTTPYWNEKWVYAAEAYFGLKRRSPIWRRLFGPAQTNTLAMRKAFLDALIQRRSTPNTP